ncbi:hypothetical protein OV203_07380 [Nannocystis sp. ILAH1]|uniref:hypothetical protein n=1 Tax=unclassified Nannocystis TaxID=2627009 RepID=UPI00226F198C|nr:MULTISPECIES: hypothetical protein [unclassified Nannocystis]MCY0986937.1 hypothetical protein [Nannocystis sp. ILAH1]MCY1071821.1 hypothetical protein [Nannocystis sp. RBIL2]
MTTFEQIQRQLWDSLMDHERRVFLQLIQDELPSLTLRELGEILTSPAARSVGTLPVSSLLGGTAAPEVTRPAPAKSPRRAPGRVADKSVDSPPTPRPRLRPVSAPQSPVSDGDLAEAEAAADAAARALEAPAPALALEARPEPAAANQTPRASRSEAPQRRPRPEPAQLEIAPVSDRSNVDVVRSAMSRTLAQHNRFDPDTLVMNALRTTSEPIRAKDLRPRVGLQPDDLRSVLNRLVKTGAIRRDGEGPDTVYQVFTASAEAAAPLA